MQGTTVNPFGGASYVPDPLAQFLSRVVPWVPGGYVNIHAWTPKGNPKTNYRRGGGGRAFADFNTEYGEILQYVALLNRDGDEVFVCMSSRSACGATDARGGRIIRKASRATRFDPRHPDKAITSPVALKALWLDLDVKSKGYASQAAAVAAAKAFCADLGLTIGFLVSSGAGIHVYIVLDRPVMPDVWRALASSLVNAAAAKGLKIDKVSMDDERLLRLPTTFNRKDWNNPLPCSVLETGPDMTPDDVRAALVAYPPTPEVRPAPDRPVQALDPAVFPPRPPLTSGPDFERVRAERERNRIVTSIDLVRAACPVVRDSEGRGGDGDIEPLWFELAKLCHYVQDGRDYFHRLSDQDPRYEREATDRKYDVAAPQGWPACATIAASSPAAAAVCSSCSFFGQGQSPINFATRSQLGTNTSALPTQAMTPPATTPPVTSYMNGATGFQTVPQTGNPIFISNLNAVGHQLVNGFVVNSAGQQVFKTPVSDIDVAWETDRSGRRVLRVNATIPDGTKTNDDKVVTFLAGEIGSPAGATSVRNQGLTFEPKNHAMVVTLVDDYTSYVRRQLAAGKETRLGWVMTNGAVTGFSYGGFLFDANGKHFSSVALPDDPLTPRGNLADWRTAANFWVGRGCIEMEVMMATAFASPLLAITSSAGIIVFARANTGYGKTASLHTSASVWGSKAQVPTSATINWIDSEIARKNNLPVYYDEIVPAPKQQGGRFGEMVLRITGGTDRGRNDRANNHGIVRMSRTMMVAASNHSLTEIASTKDTGAQAARVVEIEMSDAIKRLREPESVTAQVQMMLEANCGQAGLVYAEYLGRNHANVAAAVTATMQWFEAKLGVDSAERYWMNAAATLLVGATISKKLGLIDFDILSMRKFLLQQLRRQRAAVKDLAVDPDDPDVQLARVKNFMNDNRNWIVTDTLAKQGGALASCALIPNSDLHYQQMRGGFALRYAVDDKKLLISEEKLKLWCGHQEINYRQLHKTLEKHHYCQRPRRQRALTAGTRLNSATETVLIFDLTFSPNSTLMTEDDGV